MSLRAELANRRGLQLAAVTRDKSARRSSEPQPSVFGRGGRALFDPAGLLLEGGLMRAAVLPTAEPCLVVPAVPSFSAADHLAPQLALVSLRGALRAASALVAWPGLMALPLPAYADSGGWRSATPLRPAG